MRRWLWPNRRVAGDGTASRNLRWRVPLHWDATRRKYTMRISLREGSELTNGEGMDIGLDDTGDATAHELIDSMGMDGRVVMFG